MDKEQLQQIKDDYAMMRERRLKVKEDTDTSPVRIMIMETRDYVIKELNQNKLNFV